MSRIYIATRKSDAHPDVARVIEGLRAEYPLGTFVEGVRAAAGTEAYRTMVEAAMRETVGTVVIAGPEFNTEPDALGKRRLDDPNDPLRIELEAALKYHKFMIVIGLVGGALMPEPNELPRSLRALTRRGYVTMGMGESFDAHQSYLNKSVLWMVNGTAKRSLRIVTTFFILLMLAIVAFIIFNIASGTMTS